MATRLYRPVRSIGDAAAGLLPGRRRQRDRTLRLYGTFVKPGDVVFDIGANVGNRTRVFRELGARVVAVEPQSFCVKRLRQRFGADPNVTVVNAALGRTAGSAEMHTSQAHVISSLSTAWLSSVRQSGRFGPHRWEGVETVAVTTMDALVSQFGLPAFCKVDVEGFESEVFAGLSKDVAAVSFECTPEFAANTTACIDRLTQLGSYEYNLNFGETMQFELERWVDGDGIRSVIARMDRRAMADIYARRREPRDTSKIEAATSVAALP